MSTQFTAESMIVDGLLLSEMAATHVFNHQKEIMTWAEDAPQHPLMCPCPIGAHFSFDNIHNIENLTATTSF